MKTIFKFLLLIAIANLMTFCSRSSDTTDDTNNTNIPDTGLYVSQQYTNAELQYKEDVPYSTRPNRIYNGLYMQYTSEDTKAEERKLSTLTMKMDIFLPPASNTNKKPLIMFIHGGGFIGGDKDALRKEALSFAQAGYVAATINYRLTAQNTATQATRIQAMLDALEDAQNAIRFLKSKATELNIDVNRVAISGGSAGGATALFCAVEFDSPNLINDFPGISGKVQAAMPTGATLVNDDVGNAGISLLHFDANDVPVQLFHAKETDSSTGATWTGSVLPTQKLINDSGNTCLVVPQPNMTHTVDLMVGGEYWKDMKPFLWKYLKLSELK